MLQFVWKVSLNLNSSLWADNPACIAAPELPNPLFPLLFMVGLIGFLFYRRILSRQSARISLFLFLFTLFNLFTMLVSSSYFLSTLYIRRHHPQITIHNNWAERQIAKIVFFRRPFRCAVSRKQPLLRVLSQFLLEERAWAVNCTCDCAADGPTGANQCIDRYGADFSACHDCQGSSPNSSCGVIHEGKNERRKNAIVVKGSIGNFRSGS